MIHRECTIKVHKGSNLVTIEILGDLTASAEKPLNEAYREVCDLNIRDILLKFDGKSRINSEYSAWEWVPAGESFGLPAGKHRLVVYNKEDGVKLDCMVLYREGESR